MRFPRACADSCRQPKHSRAARAIAGFTLIESLLVIVVLAIVVGMVAMFIRMPFIAYVDTAARAELVDVADTTLRRMARDIRLALPNSVRISPAVADPGAPKYLELLPTKIGGRYLHADDGLAGNILQFERPGVDCAATPNDAACVFDVLGAMPVAPQDIIAGDKIVVYNLGLAGADAYAVNNMATVRSVVGNSVFLANQPFAAQQPAMQSPTRRFQVVSGPVIYFCDPKSAVNPAGSGKLLRYANHNLTSAQVTPPTLPAGPNMQTALLADGVLACSFDYEAVKNQHSGLVGLRIKLKRFDKDAAGEVELLHQVHVDNTP